MDIALPVIPHRYIRRVFLCGFLLWACLLSASVGLAQTSLNLPFFDDFAKPSGATGEQPNTALWMPGSGVYINNTMGINQPTVNVATFDGLRANGLPYIQTNQLAQDYTDTLTSRPINLGAMTAGSGVYLSFFYQIKGLGEQPDGGSISILPRKSVVPGDTTTKFDTIVNQPADSLLLQFLGKDNVWRNVWAIAGDTTNNNFIQAFVSITNPIYFHPGFAFRFRSFGRASGPFDTWHIDYVYLNKGRSPNDKFVLDAAMRQALSPFLKRYTAMPLAQYLVKPDAETADTITTDVRNLNNVLNNLKYNFIVRDEVSGRVLQADTLEATNRFLIGESALLRKTVRPVSAKSLSGATRAVLRYEYSIKTSDEQNPTIPGRVLKQNDTISTRAVLDNYYAYDDGTWEYGLQLGPRERVAVRFILNKPDTMAGVQACIVPFRTNQTGQPFVITVYGNSGRINNGKVDGQPGPVLYQKAFTMQYPASRNGFINFQFDRGITVNDTFYIGYQQISTIDTTFLRLGFDKNSPFGSQIFYNGGSLWEQNLAKATSPNNAGVNLPGAFMLRPVMGGKGTGLVTAIDEPKPQIPLQAYPNPTAGLIHWDSQRVNRLDVINLTGRILHSVEPSRGQQTLDLSHLPDGLYLLRFVESDRSAVQKVIIQH
ncbi:T9SS type A sorting domain-containing protein [Spirosoma endbachense]|uniref:T9SS type A sorting domain-containing protein n=1 Tax=Spirosoma endbachense TaxID=2666025 RepID=A0A6P1VV31_9BACT|nr:T9SS type A sorting domain-containing protein [Spirosoma endbachense]QHV95932.1 T9SS type A sorting domain-containing protein [Spirosoma endbachense]